MLSHGSRGKVLSLDQQVNPQSPSSGLVREVLLKKHPNPGVVDPDTVLLKAELSLNHDPHPVVFDCINGDLIRSMALRCQGAAGPSGVNAAGWKRLCSSFKKASSELCHSLALVARQLCSSYVDPNGLSAFVACRMIALDKNPGVRPIGIGETCRRIISKAILAVVGQDVIDAMGPLQLCAGQESGCEVAIHCLRQMYSESTTEALLLVDAENAFNSLNRETALRNVLHLCPSLGRILVNTYREKVSMFIAGEAIHSLEGTTQGDPLAMAMYSLGVTPLITHTSQVNSTRQVWYADDSTACGSIKDIRDWWTVLVDTGPQYGYYSNSAKTWLLVKEDQRNLAVDLFHDTNVSITSEDRTILGSPIGTDCYITDWVTNKVQARTLNLKQLVLLSHMV